MLRDAMGREHGMRKYLPEKRPEPSTHEITVTVSFKDQDQELDV